jgi:hypothetical protein
MIRDIDRPPGQEGNRRQRSRQTLRYAHAMAEANPVDISPAEPAGGYSPMTLGV